MIASAVRQALGHWTVATVCQGHMQTGTIDELATDSAPHFQSMNTAFGPPARCSALQSVTFLWHDSLRLGFTEAAIAVWCKWVLSVAVV